MDLNGKVALVTGAARRIGRAITLRLARGGCDVAVHFGRSLDEAEETARQCRAMGSRAAVFQANLADIAATQALVPRVVEELGRLDVLVNNASIFEAMGVADFDPARWELTQRINVTAPMILTHAAAAVFAKQGGGGRIVNLCDSATARPWRGHLAYLASKGAMDTLTRALARALAPGVNVVGIAPGVAAWPDHYDEALRERVTARIPLGRPGAPEDIAAVVHFVLAEGDHITGSILNVDGGMHLG